jgi:hypothetical protein
MPQFLLEQAAQAKIHADRYGNESANAALFRDPACDGK